MRRQDEKQPWGACSPKAVFRSVCIARQRDMSMKRSVMRMAPLDFRFFGCTLLSLLCNRNQIILTTGYRTQFLTSVPSLLFCAGYIAQISSPIPTLRLSSGYIASFSSSIPTPSALRWVYSANFLSYTHASALRWVYSANFLSYTHASTLRWV